MRRRCFCVQGLRLRACVILALLALGSTPDEARADLVGDVNGILAWTRQPANYSDIENPSRGRSVSIDPYAHGPRTRTMLDIQYGARRHYRGISLATLVKAYPHRKGLDLIILHFSNGMRVPVEIAALDSLDAFLAVEACEAGGKRCKVEFEDVSRTEVYGDREDPRPIHFTWNKLVVSKATIQTSRGAADREFSPWRHIDSLLGLEFANKVAYERQFAIGSSGGHKVFLARCHACHGARQVGARFGWDFVTPLPIFKKRTPETLTNHVKYPKAMAQKLGIQMPPQSDVELPEMRRLWEWMRDAARKPMRPYEPRAK